MKAVWTGLRLRAYLLIVLLLGVPICSAAQGFTQLCADRAAVERVYHENRLGEKPPFAQAMPEGLIARLVRDDQIRESALRQAYGVEITPEQVATEVQRINTTTRAPELLAELKAALGNSDSRFARTVARPILVERILRARFANDDRLHAPQRAAVEQVRAELLVARDAAAAPEKLRAVTGGQCTDTTWQLAARPTGAEPAFPVAPVQTKVTARGGPYSNDATMQLAQVLAPAPAAESTLNYLEDIDPALQRVLQAQLRQAGDVSAVIETPERFLLYVARERTERILRTSALQLPKRSYEEWVAGFTAHPN